MPFERFDFLLLRRVLRRRFIIARRSQTGDADGNLTRRIETQFSRAVLSEPVTKNEPLTLSLPEVCVVPSSRAYYCVELNKRAKTT